MYIDMYIYRCGRSLGCTASPAGRRSRGAGEEARGPVLHARLRADNILAHGEPRDLPKLPFARTAPSRRQSAKTAEWRLRRRPAATPSAAAEAQKSGWSAKPSRSRSQPW